MADWLKSMQQTYEFYIVDPNTWKDKKQLKTVKSCSINRDSEVDTLGSATIDITESIGECYIRVYLITIQNGVTEKHPLGTFLVQTMPSSFDGIVTSVSADAYTPLLELKENPPPLGYSILKGGNVMDYAYLLTREQTRAPVVRTVGNGKNLVENSSDLWKGMTVSDVGIIDWSAKNQLENSHTLKTLDLIPGDKVTYSLDLNAINKTLGAMLVFINAAGEIIETHKSNNYALAGSSGHCSVSAIIPPDCASLSLSVFAKSMFTEETVEQYRALKLEKMFVDKNLYSDFVSNSSDTWLTFIRDLLGYVEYSFELDELGRVLFAPKQDVTSMQPVWTYTDDENASILYPEISTSQDLFDIPNVVEVTYSNGSKSYRGIAINDDSNSPVSTVSRGRKITRRIDNPQFQGEPSELQVQEYAEQMLKQLSTIECTISYKHGYCPVRIGDCVRINCEKAGLKDVKAKVISQNIKCEHGCPVTEKAVFNKELWR